MSIKRLVIIIISMGLLALALFPVYAQNAQPQSTIRPKTIAAPPSASGAGTQSLQGSSDVLQNLKIRADTEIARRIDALNKLIARINSIKKLTSAQKSDLQTQIQSQIDSLNTLKAKIDADTDIVTLRADVKSIVTDYRIFAFYIQYINVLATTERMQTVLDNMQTVYTKLQTRLQNAGTGQNTATLSAELLNMQTQISNVNTILTSVNTEVLTLSVDGYPSNKTILMNERTKLRSAFGDIKTVYQDAKSIIEALFNLGDELKTIKSGSPSATTQ